MKKREITLDELTQEIVEAGFKESAKGLKKKWKPEPYKKHVPSKRTFKEFEVKKLMMITAIEYAGIGAPTDEKEHANFDKRLIKYISRTIDKWLK